MLLSWPLLLQWLLLLLIARRLLLHLGSLAGSHRSLRSIKSSDAAWIAHDSCLLTKMPFEHLMPSRSSISRCVHWWKHRLLLLLLSLNFSWLLHQRRDQTVFDVAVMLLQASLHRSFLLFSQRCGIEQVCHQVSARDLLGELLLGNLIRLGPNGLRSVVLMQEILVREELLIFVVIHCIVGVDLVKLLPDHCIGVSLLLLLLGVPCSSWEHSKLQNVVPLPLTLASILISLLVVLPRSCDQ